MRDILFSTLSARMRGLSKAFMALAIVCSVGVVSANAQSNCEPSLIVTCAPDQFVYCGDLEEFVPPVPSFEPDGCENFITGALSFSFDPVLISSGDCSSTYSVNWIVTLGNASGTCSHILTVFDNVGPEFDSVPESITVECGTEIPGPAELSATDACGEVTEVVVFTSTTDTGEGINTGFEICQLTTPIGPGPDHAVWLNGVQALGLAASNHWSWIGSPSLTRFPDGTAHVVGDVVNNANAAQAWHVDMWFENRRNWDEWSALGRSYKDDLNLATPGALYESWDYYELVPTFSRLTGFNAYEGNELYLSHQPENFYFGFQFGDAANNRNANDGFSGWFYWEGWYNGQWRSGNGDLFTDNTCAQFEVECELETTYVWRAQDACGNNTFASQTITVVDTTGPVFENCPENVTIECGDELPEVPMVTAVDACTATTVTYLGQSEIEYDGPCYGTLTRTWAADDECNNRTWCIQTITIVDTTPPAFTYVPENATYECDEEIVFEDATASDICQESASVSVSEEMIEGECPQEYTIIRTFTASDVCQNATTAQQVITVVDTTAPVFDEYDMYIAVECTEVDNVPALTATDNCGVVTVELESEILNSGGCLGVLQRLYIATDECGNSTEAYQFITILDTTAPVIENPENFTAECDNVPSLPEIEIYDNCGYDVTVETSTEILPGECENNYTIVWTWTATDYCENVSTASTSVTIVDTTDPVFDFLPQDEYYECDETIAEPTIPGATDNCDDDVTVTFTEETFPGECPQEYSIQRVIRAFDNCGNQAIWSVMIYVTDDTAPVFAEQQSFYTYECDTTIPTIEPEVSDNCGAVTLTSEDEEMIESECYGYTYRTWTATDECGNSSTFVQTFMIQDTTDPIFAGDVEIELPCDDYAGIYVTATDNCDEEVEIVVVNDEPVSGGCQGRIIRTYGAWDNCDNYAEFMQIITLTDEVAPVLEEATADFTVECDEEYAIPTAWFMDNCDDELEYDTTMASSTDGCTTTVTYTITATDNCDNSASHTVTVTIVDTTDPMVYAPQGGEFECDEEIVYGMAEATDNCDEELEITFSDEVFPGECPQSYSIVRTWTATDDCGNAGSATTTYYVYDWTAPSLEIADDVTVECDEEIPAASWVASDNCGELTEEVTEVIVPGQCENSYVIERTYTVTDECDNSTSLTQYITVQDTTDPIFAGDIEIDLPCDNYSGIYVTASDNCDNEVEIEVINDEPVSGGCQGRIIRTYGAWDNCGNYAEFTQIITLTDEVAPVLEEATADFTVECDEEYAIPTAWFMDNCDDELEYSTEMASSTDGCTTTVTYTITATDNCDNSASHTVTVTIVDTTDPIVFAPQGGEFECDEEIVYGMAEATDNCDEELEITFADEVFPGECPQSYSIVRTWTATDDCGNAGSATTTYYVYDWTAPSLEIADDVTVECDQEIPAASWVASDNCGELTEEVTEVIVPGQCENSYVIERTYTVTDECDNSTSLTQYITVQDTTDPVFAGEVEIDLPCDNYSGIYVTASDNCDSEVEIEVINDEPVSGGCQGRIIRTYGAWDNCGNYAEFMQIITLTDEVAPVLEEATADFTVECDEEYAIPTAWFMDNCDDELEYNTEMASSTDGCTTTVTYTITATDNCDNSASHTVTVTIVDTTDPIVFAPQGGEFECDEEIVYGMAEATDNCDEELEITFADEVFPGECPQSYSIVRTWTATDDCGNAGSATTTYYVYDWTAPVFDFVPENESYDCAPENWMPAEVTATDNCGDVTIEVSVDPGLDECGNGTIYVMYTATDECGNSSYITYTATILDDVAPMLSDYPADMNMECGAELPAVPEIFATDNCDNSPSVTFEEYMIGDAPNLEEGEIAVCDIATPDLGTNPCNYPVDWAMALFAMPSSYRWYQVESGELVQYEDGTIHLVARMHNAYDNTSGFDVDVTFGNGMNWAAWSTQAFMTSFKADCNGVDANFQDWMYFLLQAGEGAELVGYGAYEGSALNLVHAPSNNYFGFQLGNGANNLTDSENGFGGWFTYSGTFLVNGQQIMSGNASGAGDFALDLDCCPDYTVVRCWTAMDCSGNIEQHCQNLVYGDGAVNDNDTAPLAQTFDVAEKGDMEIVAVYPNPAADQVEIKFVSNVQNKVTLDVVDMTGRVVAKIYGGDVESGLVYKFTFNAGQVENGLYQVRLMSNTEAKTKTLSVVR